MIQLLEGGAWLVDGVQVIPDGPEASAAVEAAAGKKPVKEEAKKETISYGILESHNTSGNMENLKIRFDKLTSHDITFVGIIQTARASGLTKFPIPYVLTNCHNTLCAVGGTINEDDHMFGLSAAKKYGGIYVPPHIAVIHQYMREMMAGCGKMILGSDSHTRYGALGTMAVGEGGGELVKQLLRDQAVTGVRVRNKKTGEERDIPCGGVFVAVGYLPNTELYRGQVELDEAGYVLADETTQTNLPGVFAVGDLRKKPLRQVVTAASDGAVAAHFIEEYLNQ